MTFFKPEQQNSSKCKRIFASLAVTLALYCAVVGTYFFAASAGVRDSVVRLHILANSDSEADQAVKIKVRDALLEAKSEYPDCESKENAMEYFKRSVGEFSGIANTVLNENGFDYGAKTTVCREYFTTRAYGELTFPAGVYTSVKVTLGEGTGHNWWCVMFPPLCVPAASGVDTDESALDYLSESGEKIVTDSKKYDVRFKLLEWYEEVAAYFASK